jgi:hypothetical protein
MPMPVVCIGIVLVGVVERIECRVSRRPRLAWVAG